MQGVEIFHALAVGKVSYRIKMVEYEQRIALEIATDTRTPSGLEKLTQPLVADAGNCQAHLVALPVW